MLEEMQRTRQLVAVCRATLNQRQAPNMAAIASRAAGCRLQSAQAVAASVAYKMKISCGMSRAGWMTVMKRFLSTESSPSNVVDVTMQNLQTVLEVGD